MKMQQHFELVVEALNLVDETEVLRAVEILRKAGERGSLVWIMGNGGSAATASHFANDLVKMCHIKAIDISGMTPVTLAMGNDFGWERMFANVIKELANPLDVLVAISCSGNSKNIVAAVEESEFKTYVIALTGPGNSNLSKLEPVALIRAMSDEIRVMEDIHSIVCHAIAGELKERAL